MKHKIGVCQFEPHFMQIDKNRNKMLSMVSDIEADLIVFPELATSGYSFKDIDEVRYVAENAEDGETTTQFTRLAKEKDCSYVIGFAEKAGEKLYNSSILINPDGSKHVYRKTHLFLDEKLYFEPGDTGFKVFKAKNDLAIGMMICFDWIFPESARSLMLNGAEIIAHSANLVLPWCQQAMLTRSLENRVFSITSNRTGRELNGEIDNRFTGMSQIIDTKGNILTRMDETEENVRIIEIDIREAKDKAITHRNNILSDRREEYYHS